MEDDFLDDTEMEKLDTSWIDNFEKEDILYKDFYLEDLSYINLYFIYLDESDNIQKTKKNKYILNNNNYVSREELFKIIMKNKEIESTDSSGNKIKSEKYKLLSLFKYNFTIEPSNIPYFLKNNRNDDDDLYLFNINSIENVYFNKTIRMFQNLNSITIIYKKSNISSENNMNKTKKLQLKNMIKKTRRIYT
jgi:hypothetical protein